MSNDSFYTRINNTLWFVWGGGFPERNSFLVAQPMEEHGGWKETDKRTPSGKLLFVCETCGRYSPAPDKRCPIGRIINLTDQLVIEPLGK